MKEPPMTDKPAGEAIDWNKLTPEERTEHYAALAARRESMKSDPLLPCPFCGNQKPYRNTVYDYIGPNEGLGSGGTIDREYVQCGICGARGQAPNPDAGHWNMRPPQAGNSRDEVIEEAARVCDELDKILPTGCMDAEDCAKAIRALARGRE